MHYLKSIFAKVFANNPSAEKGIPSNGSSVNLEVEVLWSPTPVSELIRRPKQLPRLDPRGN